MVNNTIIVQGLGHPSNPHEQYTDAWYEWENKRITAQALEQWIAFNQELGDLSKPEPENPLDEIYSKISLLVKNQAILAPSHFTQQLIQLKSQYADVISAWDFDKLVESIREERKAKSDPDERLKLDVLAWKDEKDPICRLRRKGEICSNYRISAKDLELLAKSLDKDCNATKPKCFTGAEFLKLEGEGVQWLSPGLVPKRGITLLAGSPGAGKTTMAYDLAASVLYGEEFLGETPVETGKVLFVTTDEPNCFAQDKFVGRGFAFDNNWRVLTDWDITQITELEKQLEDFRPTLVVLDSFASIHKDQSFDENSAQAKTTVYQLQNLSDRYGCALVLIHHTNKDKDKKGVGKVRGSSAIAGAVSAVLLLEGDGRIRTLSTPKIRGAEPIRWQVTMDSQTYRFSVVEGKDDSTKPIAQRILEFFKSHCTTQRVEFEEILKAVGGVKDSIYKGLQRLVQSGLLVRRPGSRDPRQRVWGLPKISTYTGEKAEGHSPPPTPHNLSNIISETQSQQSLEHIGQILDTNWTVYEEFPEEYNRPISWNPDTVSNPEIILDSPPLEGGESPPVQDEPAEKVWEGVPPDSSAGGFQKGQLVVKGQGFDVKRGELLRYAGCAHWHVRVGKKGLDLWKVGTFRSAVR